MDSQLFRKPPRRPIPTEPSATSTSVVNESFAVFDKSTGALTRWSCATSSFSRSGQPILRRQQRRDPIAHTTRQTTAGSPQFSVTNGGSSGYWQCIALKTSDATAPTSTPTNSPTSTTIQIRRLERNLLRHLQHVQRQLLRRSSPLRLRRRLHAHRSACREQCFQLSTPTAEFSRDVDGAAAPPSGPNEYSSASAPTASTLGASTSTSPRVRTPRTGPTLLRSHPFSAACGGGTCVPQPNNPAARFPRRPPHCIASPTVIQRRHEALSSIIPYPGSVVAGSPLVRAAPGCLRRRHSLPTVHLRARRRPEPMDGLIASDKNGNLAVDTAPPAHQAIRHPVLYRTPTDTISTLGSEQLIFAGSGSSCVTSSLGDYSAMTVDQSTTHLLVHQRVPPQQRTSTGHTHIAPSKSRAATKQRNSS